MELDYNYIVQNCGDASWQVNVIIPNIITMNRDPNASETCTSFWMNDANFELLQSIMFQHSRIDTFPIGIFSMSSIKKIGFVHSYDISALTLLDMIGNTLNNGQEFTLNKKSDTNDTLADSGACNVKKCICFAFFCFRFLSLATVSTNLIHCTFNVIAILAQNSVNALCFTVITILWNLLRKHPILCDTYSTYEYCWIT